MRKIGTDEVQVITSQATSELSINISPDNIGHLFNVLINTYSNPIKASIQELCSNARDASGVFKCGIENRMFYVQDYGKGMSPEFMKDVFFNILSSTKRGDDQAIGYFGIGSKAPLAYTDAFTIITVWEGVKYTYSIFRDSEIPKAVPLSSEPTTEVGTRVLVPIKDYDLKKWENQMVEVTELFEGSYYNETKISTRQWEGYQLVNKGLVLAIGPVKYDLNWDYFDKYKHLSGLPLALQLGLTGDVSPSPSRENLIYNETAINFITEKLKQLDDKLFEYFKTNANKYHWGQLIHSVYSKSIDIDLFLESEELIDTVTIKDTTGVNGRYYPIIIDALPNDFKTIAKDHNKLSLAYNIITCKIGQINEDNGRYRYYHGSKYYHNDLVVPYYIKKFVGKYSRIYNFSEVGKGFKPEVLKKLTEYSIKHNNLILTSTIEKEVRGKKVTVSSQGYTVQKGVVNIEDVCSFDKENPIKIAFTSAGFNPTLKKLLPCCGIITVRFDSKKQKKLGIEMGRMIDGDSITVTQKGIIRRLMRKALELKATKSIGYLIPVIEKYGSIISKVDPELYQVCISFKSVNHEYFDWNQADEVLNLGKTLGISIPKLEYKVELIQRYLDMLQVLEIIDYENRYSHNRLSDKADELVKTYYNLCKQKDFILRTANKLGYDNQKVEYLVSDDCGQLLLEATDPGRTAEVLESHES